MIDLEYEEGTLFFVDDHKMMINGLIHWVEKSTSWKIIGSANSINEAKRVLETRIPEICIIDIQLGEESGFDLLKFLTENHPKIKCIIFSMYDSCGYVSQAKILGAKGYVSKTCSEDVLSKCLDIVKNGGTFIEEKLMSKQQKIEEISQFMTKRERQVFDEILKNSTNEQIAEKINISIHSVECYVSRIYDIANCRSRVQLLKEFNS